MSMGLIDVIYNLVCDHTENGNLSGNGNSFALKPYINPRYHLPLISVER